MMKNKILSKERKEYLNKIKKEKFGVLFTQIFILFGLILIWEILARAKIIDSFITSQPSRILNTFLNLTSDNLLHHLWVTAYETIVGFVIGTILGSLIAIILWWSKFLERVSEPFLVVLNSLPKVALRTNNYIMGRCWNSSYNSNGNSNCDGGLLTTDTCKLAGASNSKMKRFELDRQAVAKLFSKMKEKEKNNKIVNLKVDRVPKDIPRPELKDFAEQMVYFRKRLGYSQKQAGHAIGVSEDTYRRYELREVEIIDLKKINKIVKALEFTEKPIVSEYVEFLMSKPEKMLVKFFKESGISKNEFARRIGFNRRSILEWINKGKSISKESYYRIKKFMKEFEEEKLYKEQLMEEEEEME